MSFRLKTVIGIATIELVLLTILVVSGLHYLKSSNEQQFNDRAVTTAQLLATMTTDAVVAYDLATLDSLVEEALKNRDLSYVRVRGRDDVVLSKGGDEEALALLDSQALPGTIKDGRIDVSNPISIEGAPFGFVDIGLNTSSLDVTLRDATQWMLSVAAAEIVLVAIFGYLLGRILTNQLSALQIGARRVAGGELGYQLAVNGKDELADTAHSFNTMSASLAVYARELEEAKTIAEAGRDSAESILKDAITSLSEGVVIADDDGNISHINTAFTALHDGSLPLDAMHNLSMVDAALSETVDIAIDGTATIDDLLNNDADSENARAVDRFSVAAHGGQWTYRFTDERTILYTASRMADGGKVIVASDVSAIYHAEFNARALERELLQSQKLEAIGTLAGGIAHELNTPIQFVGDNLSFIGDAYRDLSSVVEHHTVLLDALENGTKEINNLAEMNDALQAADFEFLKEELPAAIDQSSDGVKQMANIVLAMKEFAYPTQKEKGTVDVNRALDRATLVSRNEWKYVADLEWSLSEPAPQALVNEGELNQVILNLIVNAGHAVKAANRDSGHIALRTSVRDGFVIIEVADNGTGIPKDIQHRVFDQFFTTKDVGKGTGQGLALCYDFIVNRNNGRIYFESESGIGTTFFVELPLSAANEMGADD